jgi:hypothetical protein
MTQSTSFLKTPKVHFEYDSSEWGVKVRAVVAFKGMRALVTDLITSELNVEP